MLCLALSAAILKSVRNIIGGSILADFILLMHSDYETSGGAEHWDTYPESLSRAGELRGGSAIGGGSMRDLLQGEAATT